MASTCRAGRDPRRRHRTPHPRVQHRGRTGHWPAGPSREGPREVLRSPVHAHQADRRARASCATPMPSATSHPNGAHRARFGFTFTDDHETFLAAGLPINAPTQNPGWPLKPIRSVVLALLRRSGRCGHVGQLRLPADPPGHPHRGAGSGEPRKTSSRSAELPTTATSPTRSVRRTAAPARSRPPTRPGSGCR